MKYVKPIFQDLGKVLSIASGTCGTGSNPNDIFASAGKCTAGYGEGNATCLGGSVVSRANPNSCSGGFTFAGRLCGAGGTPDANI